LRVLLLAFVAGCWTLQQQAGLPPGGWFAVGGAAAAVLLAIVVARPPTTAARLLAAGLAFACGFAWAGWRADLRMAAWLPATLEGAQVDVTGVVAWLPAGTTPGMRFAFDVERGAEPLPARILLSWREAPTDLRPGQRYTFDVRLRRPRGLANPHGLDYAYWLLAHGYGATGHVAAVRDGPALPASTRFGWRVEAARAAIRDRMYAALPGDARFGAVLVALAIGDQRGIRAEDWRLFARTGTGHLVAISGLHIGLVAGLAGGLVYWLWRHSLGFGHRLRRPLPLRLPARKAALVAMVVTACAYGLLAGMQVPAQRTLAMLMVAALATWSGRAPPPSLVLGWAAFAAVALDPWAVLSAGFWLSFGAVAAIFLMAQRGPASPAGGWRGRVLNALANAARTQWAVTIGLVPATLLLFQQVSVVSPLANALAIPVVSFVVTPLALLGAVAPHWLAAPALAVAHAVMTWLAVPLAWLAAPDWAVWQSARPGPMALGLAVLGLPFWFVPRVFGRRTRLHGALCLLPLVFSGREPVRHGEFRAAMLDVGQGTAVLVETQSRALLYDSGPAGRVPGASAGARVVVPHLRGVGVGRLDLVMISHEDADHAGGALDILAALPVASLQGSAPAGHPLLGDGDWQACVAGQQWEWDGVRFDVLHPPAAASQNEAVGSNARSCVLRVATAHRTLLLTGDIGKAEEAALIRTAPDSLRADVLVVPHHGSGTSSSREFLLAVAPEAAVFQVGYANRYRHPRADVWRRYAREGIDRYRTDLDGMVTMETDGAGYTLSAFREVRPRYWRARAPPD